MNNKLGLTNSNKIKKIEYYLFNIKYHIIDENYTFNEEDLFSTDYLEKIHIFLFNDIYELEDCKIRKQISDKQKQEINKLLKLIQKKLLNEDYEGIKEIIYSIWYQQIFYDGNTRTILCFLKIISNLFNLKVNYDFTKDIDKDYFINEVIESIEENKKIK